MLHDCARDLWEAANLLQKGQIVGVPTETVYGLAGDAKNPQTIRQIFCAKGRPADNPLIVHIARFSQLQEVASVVPRLARVLAGQFWPGPLTMVLRKNPAIPAVTSGGLETVGIRMPAHPAARLLIALSGKVLAAPSANRSGYPSPTTAEHVYQDMRGKIAAVLDGGTCAVGVESTVIAIEKGDAIRILRPGAVTAEMLMPFAQTVIMDDAVMHPLSYGQVAPSPGMKYRHYAPHAHVVLLEGSGEGFAKWVNAHLSEDAYALSFDGETAKIDMPCVSYGNSSRQQAQQVFAKLRQLDDLGAKEVYVHAPTTEGIGLAVYNRLVRAAGFEVIQV